MEEEEQQGLPPKGPDCCYVCGFDVSLRRIGINEVSVCRRCGMGAIRTGATSDDYWNRQNETDELKEVYWAARRKLFHTALARFEDQGLRGKVVDLGGGVGHFSEIALERGWDAYSLDTSQLAVEAAARRVGSVRSLGATDMDSFEGKCDLVTLWCVIAHVAEPLKLLEQGLALLKPGGRLLVTTPNFLFQAPYVRTLARIGTRVDFLAHDHILHFTPHALERLLMKAGFSECSYVYLGVTEECVVRRGLAGFVIPLKRAWNRAGVWAGRVGLPLFCGELQVIATKPALEAGPGDSELNRS